MAQRRHPSGPQIRKEFWNSFSARFVKGTIQENQLFLLFSYSLVIKEKVMARKGPRLSNRGRAGNSAGGSTSTTYALLVAIGALVAAWGWTAAAPSSKAPAPEKTATFDSSRDHMCDCALSEVCWAVNKTTIALDELWHAPRSSRKRPTIGVFMMYTDEIADYTVTID